MTSNDHAALLSVFAQFTRSLAGTYELAQVIERLGGDLCRVLGVAGAGVMVEDDERHLRFLSTSDGTLRVLEQLQVQLGEGPCLLAYRSGARVIAGDLSDDPRFPRFGPLAVSSGMRAVYSFPMLHDDQPIGALNLYRAEPGDMSEEQATAGQAFADIASAFIVHAREDDHRTLLNRQLQTALDSRIVIEQAKGFVMGRRGTDAHTAFEALRRYARGHSLRLHDVARAVLNGTTPVEALPPGA